jgi:imidazole glycerol-phosphate synthase subunit HisF
MNTSAVQNPRLIRESSDRFGAQCIVVAIDAKRVSGRRPARWEVYIHGGRTPTGRDAVQWARTAVRFGAGEILLTSMDADGTKKGYDLDLVRAVSRAVPVPVIASGGAGEPRHFHDAFQAGAEAALAASLFHFREISIRDLKKYLLKRKVAVRPL